MTLVLRDVKTIQDYESLSLMIQSLARHHDENHFPRPENYKKIMIGFRRVLRILMARMLGMSRGIVFMIVASPCANLNCNIFMSRQNIAAKVLEKN